MKESNEHIRDYVSKILANSNLLYDFLELAKSIPMSYVPVLGIGAINETYYFRSVYDYYQMNILQKSKLRSIGPKKVANLDYATDFLLQCLKNRIQEFRLAQKVIPAGTLLLDSNLETKSNIVIAHADDIYDFLKENGEEYVFAVKKESLSTEHLLTNPNQKKIVEMN